MILWMCVTKDKYELPIAVADTAEELAKQIGLKSTNVIYTDLWHYKKGHTKSCRFRKVQVDSK